MIRSLTELVFISVLPSYIKKLTQSSASVWKFTLIWTSEKWYRFYVPLQKELIKMDIKLQFLLYWHIYTFMFSFWQLFVTSIIYNYQSLINRKRWQQHNLSILTQQSILFCNEYLYFYNNGRFVWVWQRSHPCKSKGRNTYLLPLFLYINCSLLLFWHFFRNVKAYCNLNTESLVLILR